MSKNSPAKGHHGLAARGQGKLLYYHTQIPYTDQRRKDPSSPSATSRTTTAGRAATGSRDRPRRHTHIAATTVRVAWLIRTI